ncbi:hypothetical protein VTL71DRAFT_14343, partial [Oculimacula yallundae]
MEALLLPINYICGILKNRNCPSKCHPLQSSAWRQDHVPDRNQDKDSIDTEATEYTKSGTDDGAAKQEEAAFDPSTTDPEQERKIAGKGTEGSGNPLDVSPANPEVSKQRGQTEGGAEKGVGKKQSGGGSPNKAGKA